MKGWKAVALFTAILLLVSTLNFFVLQDRQDLQYHRAGKQLNVYLKQYLQTKAKEETAYAKK